MEIALQLFLLTDERLYVLLVYEYLLAEWQPEALPLSLSPTWIPVLDVMDDDQAVLAAGEEVVVVVGKTQTLDGLAVRLDLVDLTQLGQLEDVHGAGLTFFADSSDEGFLVVGKSNLGKDDTCIKTVLRFFAVPYFLIISDSIHLKRLSWYVYDRLKEDPLLIEVLLIQPLPLLLLEYKVIEVDIAVEAA